MGCDDLHNPVSEGLVEGQEEAFTPLEHLPGEGDGTHVASNVGITVICENDVERYKPSPFLMYLM